MSGLTSPRIGPRLAFRLARRDVRMAPGRSILIAALVALPVMGLAGLATVVSSMIPTTAESIEVQLGQTQASLRMVSPPDKSLVQSPNDPNYWQVAEGSAGPLNHRNSDTTLSPSAILPGHRILSVRQTSVTFTTSRGAGSVVAIEGEPWDKSLAGRYDLASGRTPTSATEIMASPATLERLGAHLGDTIDTVLPMEKTFTIVGTLLDRSQPSNAQLLFGESAAFDGIAPDEDLGSTVFYLPSTQLNWSDVQKLNKLGAVVLSRDVLTNPPPPSSTDVPAQGPDIPWSSLTLAFPLAGFAVFEVALLAGAAFMVGARRQQRAFATLASVGANRGLLFQIIAASGLILGVIGGIVGVALGVLGARVYILATSDGSATQYPGFHPNPAILAGVIVFAALAGLIAAAIPARIASRVDVVAALRGALRPVTPRARRSVAAVAVAGVGGGITLMGSAIGALPQKQGEVNPAVVLLAFALIVIGPIVIQIGAIMLAPSILRLVSRLLARVGLGARLGSRDAARNTSRSVPALAAIMTTIFIGAFIMTYSSSSEAQQSASWDYWTAPNVAQADLSNWRPDENPPTVAQADKAATVLKTTFGATRTRLLWASPARLTGGIDNTKSQTLYATPELVPSQTCPNNKWSGLTNGVSNGGPCERAPYNFAPKIWVGDASDLSAALGHSASAAALTALTAGEAVALYPQYLKAGKITIGWRTEEAQIQDEIDQRTSSPVKSVSINAVLEQPDHGYHFSVFISEQTAERIGLKVAPTMVLADVNGPATPAQYDALNAAATSITGGDIGASPIIFRVEPGPPDSAGTEAWILLGILSLIALGAAAVALGLARADGKRDEYVLAATGASPALRRSFGFWQAVSLAGTGALFGVALGIIPAIALSFASAGNFGGTVVLNPPWTQLALTLAGIPLLIAAATWLTAGPQRGSFSYLRG